MKKNLVFSLLLIIIPQILFSETAIDFFNKGKSLQYQQNYVQAIESYSEALLLNPNYGEVWFSLAQCSYEMDEYERALVCLTSADKFYNDKLSIQRLRGLVYIGLGNIDEAQKVFNKIIEDYPNDIDTMFGLAQLQLINGRISSAEKLYTDVLLRQSKNKKALLSLALIANNLGKQNEAQYFINQAINYYSENPEVYYFAAYLDFQNKDYTKAEENIRLALFLKKDYDKANALLENILYQQKKYQDVIKLSDERIKKNRNLADAWYLKALAQDKLGLVEKAIKSSQIALEINPQDEIIREKLEQLVIENLQIEDKRRNEFAEYHVLQSKTANDKFDSKAAQYEYLKALKISPLNNTIRLSYADWLLKENHPEACFAQLNFIRKEGSDNLALLDRIESYSSLLSNTLDRKWNTNSFYLDKTRVAIGLYYFDTNTMLHVDGTKIIAKMLKNAFNLYPYFDMDCLNERVSSYTEAFTNAINKKQNYFSLFSFNETQRDCTITIDMYSSKTGSLVNSWSVYRTGNNKITKAIQKISDAIQTAFPIRGKIIQREASLVLTDLGISDKCKLDDEFVVIKKNCLLYSDEKIGLVYSDDDVLGTLKISSLGEEVSECVFEHSGLYDRMNVNDEITLLKVDENNVPTTETKKTVMNSELSNLIYSIR